jgi:hypothetical protein
LYYTGINPAVELGKPHFSKHPGLDVVTGDKGLAAFVKDYPSVLCVTQGRDLKELTGKKSVLRDRIEELPEARVGEGDDARVIFRVKGGKP